MRTRLAAHAALLLCMLVGRGAAATADTTLRLFYFSAPWCASCVLDLPQLERQLKQKLGEKLKGLKPTLYVVTGERPPSPPTDEIAKEHARKLGLSFTAAADPWRWQTYRRYFPNDSLTVPAAVLLRADGTVQQLFPTGTARPEAIVAAVAPDPEPVPTDRDEYLLGEVKTLTPAGEPLRSDVYLVKRSVRPGAGYVEVRTNVLPADGKPAVYVTTMRVTGHELALSDPPGTFSGKGQWTGSPWRWKTWRYEIDWTDGHGGITGDDSVTATHLRLVKRYRDRDGNTTQFVLGELAYVTAKTYDILLTKVMP